MSLFFKCININQHGHRDVIFLFCRISFGFRFWFFFQMPYEFSATFLLVPSSRVVKAESLPTLVTFPLYWKTEFVVLTRAENLIIVSSFKSFRQHFLQKLCLLFRIVDHYTRISWNLSEQTCVCPLHITLFILSKFTILYHNLLKKSCALYCVYQLAYQFPVLRISGSVDTMYGGLSQTAISWQHIKWLRALRSRPLKTVFI